MGHGSNAREDLADDLRGSQAVTGEWQSQRQQQTFGTGERGLADLHLSCNWRTARSVGRVGPGNTGQQPSILRGAEGLRAESVKHACRRSNRRADVAPGRIQRAGQVRRALESAGCDVGVAGEQRQIDQRLRGVARGFVRTPCNRRLGKVCRQRRADRQALDLVVHGAAAAEVDAWRAGKGGAGGQRDGEGGSDLADAGAVEHLDDWHRVDRHLDGRSAAAHRQRVAKASVDGAVTLPLGDHRSIALQIEIRDQLRRRRPEWSRCRS